MCSKEVEEGCAVREVEQGCAVREVEQGCAVREVSYTINIKCEVMTAVNVCHQFSSPAVSLLFHVIPYHINAFVATAHEFRNSIEA